MKLDEPQSPYTVEAKLAVFAQRVRDWLACSALSERITAKRCRELLTMCDEFDPNFPPR